MRAAKLTVCLLMAGVVACATDARLTDTSAGAFADAVDATPAAAPVPVPEAPIPPQITEATFVSNLHTARDPFRQYFNPGYSICGYRDFSAPPVAFEQRSLDELRPAAIIHDHRGPGVMLVDREGNGRLLRRGDLLARGEFVQTPNGGFVSHWRVARIERSRLRQGQGGRFELTPSRVVFAHVADLTPHAPDVQREVAL